MKNHAKTPMILRVDISKHGFFNSLLAAYFSGDLETAPSAVRTQSFADERHLLRDNLRVRSHEPKAARMKLPKRRLRQGELLWRTWRGVLDDRFVHDGLITQ